MGSTEGQYDKTEGILKMYCKELFLKLMGSGTVAAVSWKCSKTSSETEHQIG